MARYRILHETEYQYSEPVLLSKHIAHLKPRVAPRNKWISHEISFFPEPAAMQVRTDIFGNPVNAFSVESRHTEFRAVAEGEVSVEPVALPDVKISWENVLMRLCSVQSAEDTDAVKYTFPSPLVAWDDGIKKFATDFFTSGRDYLEALISMMTSISSEFKYLPMSTRIGTPVSEILRERHGVCQDFAHLMTGALRSIGLPARYVSGYLRTHHAQTAEANIGADATHAWASAYVPGAGWVDFDPTNNLVVSDQHVTVAWGRDFGDVSPLKGVIVGGGTHHVAVHVKVIPV
ncbi:MAG: transglutaminase family protein [Fibrobacteraceae bacterium]